ncbi:MAG TPA: TonB-dependent receptor [Terriglobales bacterium]|nr:TonB-dependent receptor [Terriglobales bacterium]
MRFWLIFLTITGVVLSAGAAAAGDGSPALGRIAGIVRDQTGAVIAGAQVEFRSAATRSKQVTGDDGRFVFDQVRARAGVVEISAAGFQQQRREWSAQTDTPLMEIVLSPASVAQQVTVTATRTGIEVGSTPTSVVVLSADKLDSIAALTLDDALRNVSGFSLFRRSGSRTANPTAQGASLRGLGASGASRAVVLSDDIPLNDPFGGWVYWGRIPRAAIRSVEVASGGVSDLYGSDALGGVVNVLRRRPDSNMFTLETSYGNQVTPDFSFLGAAHVSRWTATFSGEALHTSGYVPVDEGERGTVDRRAGSEHAVGEIMLERSFADRARVFLRGSVFGELRENGTPLQKNRTTIRELDLGGDWRSQALGVFALRGFASRQVFNQTFSAVAQDRNSETLTRVQRVPAQQLGFSLQWSRPTGKRHILVAGGEARVVRGESDELVFVGGSHTGFADAGGRERTVGVYFLDSIRITPRLLITPSGRVEHWRNFAGFSASRPLVGAATVTPFPDRSERFVSPKLGLLYRLADHASLTGSAYRAFRAPTLNELYRSFRVGNILTLSNEHLRAERLTGGEAGGIVTGARDRLMLRGTFFWSEITRPVANVTLSVTPGLITRQRQNLGRTRSRGVELQTEVQITSSFSLSGGYQFTDATVVRFPADTALEGLRIPQVPCHQFTFLARYFRPSLILLGLQGRFAGDQFEDDRNTLRLERFFTMDLMAARPIRPGIDAFLAVENVLNQRYDIGRTPVRTVAAPILARIGLRFKLGAR